MSDLRKAAQLALIELETLHNPVCGRSGTAEVIAALRAALEAPEQEPVAWMVYTLDGKSVCVTDSPSDFADGQRALPLFTFPISHNPLTDEMIVELWSWSMTADAERTANTQQHAFARAIERAHGIGGGDE